MHRPTKLAHREFIYDMNLASKELRDGFFVFIKNRCRKKLQGGGLPFRLIRLLSKRIKRRCFTYSKCGMAMSL
jgi:hypothetical protein